MDSFPALYEAFLRAAVKVYPMDTLSAIDIHDSGSVIG
jgi:hypothetical protein